MSDLPIFLRVFNALTDAINKNATAIGLAATGMDGLAQRRFDAVPVEARLSYGGPVYCYASGELSVEDALFCAEFVLDSIVDWQAHGFAPSIDASDALTEQLTEFRQKLDEARDTEGGTEVAEA